VTTRPRMIGYNRTVKLRWLDETVDLFLARQSEAAISEALRQRLEDQLSVGSQAVRGSREKTITLLLKTWVRVPSRVEGLRDDGIRVLEHLRRSERLPFHWGMTMAAYPFWRVVADVTGRLLRLQGTAGAREVQRRVRELYGERETVSRSARYVLRAFADWGVVVETDTKGRYVGQNPIKIDYPPVATWLLEATMFAGETSSTDFRTLANSPALFPFQLTRITSDALTVSRRLEVVRHGVGDDLVLLRKPMGDSQLTAGSKGEGGQF
jgi:hypothetical protein